MAAEVNPVRKVDFAKWEKNPQQVNFRLIATDFFAGKVPQIEGMTALFELGKEYEWTTAKGHKFTILPSKGMFLVKMYKNTGTLTFTNTAEGLKEELLLTVDTLDCFQGDNAEKKHTIAFAKSFFNKTNWHFLERPIPENFKLVRTSQHTDEVRIVTTKDKLTATYSPPFPKGQNWVNEEVYTYTKPANDIVETITTKKVYKELPKRGAPDEPPPACSSDCTVM